MHVKRFDESETSQIPGENMEEKCLSTWSVSAKIAIFS